MKTISVDLRERILAAYDVGDATRAQVGRRFRVSEGMVKKLLQQRRRTGEIGPRHHRSGRKARILPAHGAQLRALVQEQPDLTLAELRSTLGLSCTLPAIHYALAALDLTYKKRRSMRPNRTDPTSPKRGGAGAVRKANSIRPGSSSSTKQPPKRT